ncbi:MAG: PD40 domain-containing protein, partial [Planctomycetes bacterium]|nr:PD40 domain-containing protein [Planctomycetota bacterium]
DMSVFVPMPSLAFSQLFFPVKGILCVFDRETSQFRNLSGADDPQFVQSNPSWSPDGKYIVFARAKAPDLRNTKHQGFIWLTPAESIEFIDKGEPFLFDLYRIPFNGGKGGTPEPVEGASDNGMSNYFARYSPDGRWIVFCRAKSYMLLQPDSELYIIPAEGGNARRLRCNTSRMNSWHSFSPNGKWLVFASKAYSDYTQLCLTHIDENGCSAPAVLLAHMTEPGLAANIPEFVNAHPKSIAKIHERFLDD